MLQVCADFLYLGTVNNSNNTWHVLLWNLKSLIYMIIVKDHPMACSSVDL